MTRPLTGSEKQYRSILNRIAYTLLVFYALFNLYSLVMTYLVSPLTAGLEAPFNTVIYETVKGILYAAAFLVPVCFFAFVSRREARVPLDLQLTLPRETPLYIFAVMAIVSAAGYFNSWLLDAVDYGAFTEELIFDMGAMTNVELILTFFTLSVVPGFVEELLFRGVILKNLLPFGKTAAVVASAVLFGVMHQNAGQLLYATVAGLALGYVFVKTQSFWCCVLAHICNNFLSILTLAIGQRVVEDRATGVLLCISLAVLVLGLVAVVCLALQVRGEQGRSENDDESILPLARRVKLFFSWPMILFFAFCVAQMVFLLLLALVF